MLEILIKLGTVFRISIIFQKVNSLELIKYLSRHKIRFKINHSDKKALNKIKHRGKIKIKFETKAVGRISSHLICNSNSEERGRKIKKGVEKRLIYSQVQRLNQ